MTRKFTGKRNNSKRGTKQVYECVNKNVLYYIAFVLLASGIFVSVGGLFSTITGPGSITAHPGETVSVKFVLDYDDADLFGTSTPYVTVIQDEYKFGGDDETIWKGSLKVGTPTTISYNYRVPSEVGDYTISYDMEFKGTVFASNNLNIHVVKDEIPEDTADDTVDVATDDTTDDDSEPKQSAEIVFTDEVVGASIIVSIIAALAIIFVLYRRDRNE